MAQARKVNPKRGEIWEVDLAPVRGAEIDKKRPVVVMSDDTIGTLPVRIVVPVTWWKDQYASNPLKVLVKANSSTGLKREGAADAVQVRCVSVERFDRRFGVVPAYTIDEVAMAVGICMGYPGL